jgi:hypothetical protein
VADDEKRAFTFFRSYYEAAKELPDKHRRAFYDAVIQYGIESEETELTGVAKAMFTLVKPTLDKSQARAAAGSKGGKSKGEASDEQTPSKTQAKPEQPRSDISEDKDKDLGFRITDEDVDKDRDTDVDNVPPYPPQGRDSAEPAKPPPLSPFDQFWSVYPKKVGKAAARKAWNKLKPSAALLRKILEAIPKAQQSEEWRRENGRYIPNPSTWLNQGRWDDELTPGGGDGSGQTAGGSGKPAAPREDWSSFKPSTGFKRSSPDGE